MSESSSKQDIAMDWSMVVQECPTLVLVGKEEEAFYIHPSVLQRSSDFFQAALKSYWTEGQENEIFMPDDDSAWFRAHAGWFYSGQTPELASKTTGYQKLFELYGFGEKIMDDKFQNHIADKIHASLHELQALPDAKSIRVAYRTTPAGSPLRRLIVDVVAVKAISTILGKAGEEGYPKDFLFDLSVCLLQNRDKEISRKHEDLLNTPGLCTYHKHGPDERCENRK